MARKGIPHENLRRSLTIILCGCFVSGWLVSSFRPTSDAILADPDESHENTVPTLNPKLESSLSWSYFTQNQGQVANDEVLFYVHGSVGFTKDSVIFHMREPEPAQPAGRMDQILAHDVGTTRSQVIQLRFENVNDVMPIGVNELAHKSHYFIGNDPSKWMTDVSSYTSIVYQNIYDGIDLIFRMNGNGLKYDFVVHPDAIPSTIRMSYEGTERLALESDVNLVIYTPLGVIRDKDLYTYQEIDNVRTGIGARFVVFDDKTVGYEITGYYDKSAPLIIDPELEWSTYVGGNDADRGYSLAVDVDGNPYVTGDTYSADFPTTPGVYNSTFIGGPRDIFVSKLSSDGTTLLYSTFIGGSSSEWGLGLEVDPSGNAYITGDSWSLDFPTTPGAYNRTLSGARDVVAVKLNNNGSSLLYSTFIGGSFGDAGTSIALDPSGNAYISGLTFSSDFPTTPGAFDTVSNGGWDAFVVKLNTNGSDLNYSTYLGGGSSDFGYHITVDLNGSAYATGDTDSINYPVTPGAYQISLAGSQDEFITKLSANGSALVYSTYLGGGQWDGECIIVLDSLGYAYLTGYTRSDDFPTTIGAYDTSFNGGVGTEDVFYAKLNQNGTELLSSTFIGNSSDERGEDLAIDSSGNVYITGWTDSLGFPTTPDAYNSSYSGGLTDLFLLRLNNSGSDLNYSTFFGGSSQEMVFGLDITPGREVYIVGYTNSNDFPTTPGANDTIYNGTSDVFVSKFEFDKSPVIEAWEPGGTSGQIYTQGDIIEVTWNATDDTPLPTNPITINYGNLTIGWTIVSVNEENDGIFSWDTAAIPCPGIYWMNLSVYDDVLQTAHDESNFSFYMSCPPTIEVWEPGGTQGQTYIQGDIITVIWNASDDEPLVDSIIIYYMDVYGSLTELSSNETNDGYYSWDTSDMSCPVTYWMFITVTDSLNNTAFDIGNYSFTILCSTLPPEIVEVWVDPNPQNVGMEVTISASVTDPDTDPEDLRVNIEITDPNGVVLGNFSMSYSAISDRFEFTSVFEMEGPHTYIIWARDDDYNWDSATDSFVMKAGLHALNWKPMIALIFALIILFMGILAAYHRPIRFKKERVDTFECPSCRTLILRSSVNPEWTSSRCPKCNFVFDHKRIFAELDEVTKEPVRDLSRDRWYTFGICVLPFVIAEAITGIISFLTGLLAVLPLYGVGMIVDLIILICGIISIIVILKKGESPEQKEEPRELEKTEGMIMPPPIEEIETQEQYPETIEDETMVMKEAPEEEPEQESPESESPEFQAFFNEFVEKGEVKPEELESETDIPTPIEEVAVKEDMKSEEVEPAIEEESPHEEEPEVKEMETEEVEPEPYVPVPVVAETKIEDMKPEEAEPTIEEESPHEEVPEVKEIETKEVEPEPEIHIPIVAVTKTEEEKPEEAESQVQTPLKEEPEIKEKETEAIEPEPVVQAPIEEEKTEEIEPEHEFQAPIKKESKSRGVRIDNIMPSLWSDMPQAKKARIEERGEREVQPDDQASYRDEAAEEKETEEDEPSLAEQFPHVEETKETEPSLAKQFPHKEDTKDSEPSLAEQFPHEEETLTEELKIDEKDEVGEDSSAKKRRQKKEDEEDDLVDELQKLLD